MWKNALRPLSVSGKVRYPVPGVGLSSLPNVSVDIFRVFEDADGFFSFLRLNTLSAITNASGDFTFTDIPVEVKTKSVIPGGYPGLPIEIIQPSSLPDIVFFISGHAGTEYVGVYDERSMMDDEWFSAHPDRKTVPLTGTSSLIIDIPELSSTTIVPDDQFYFLRVGRVTRDEITDVITNVVDPDAGYMTSGTDSFYPGVVDAPFGGTLQIGGHFGKNIRLKGENIYYRLFFSPYSGDHDNPSLPPASASQITDPLFNRKYVLPTPVLPAGSWKTIALGPFDATVAGSSIQAYRMPPLYDPAVEYMPFPDLMAIWNSTAALNDLVIISIEVYEKTGEHLGVPQLTQITLVPTVNNYEFLPLRIDNRPPVPKITSWQTGYATFSPQGIGPLSDMTPCGEMTVSNGGSSGNECLVLGYGIEGDSGIAHPHLNYYSIGVLYSPRQSGVVPLEAQVPLKGQGGDPTFDAGVGKNDIDWDYSAVTPPVSNILGYSSVLVPHVPNGWPPEIAGDTYSGKQCPQYAAAVSLRCGVRTIDGWGRLFGQHYSSRHIIIKL